MLKNQDKNNVAHCTGGVNLQQLQRSRITETLLEGL